MKRVLNISHEQYSENPWEDGDCEPPILARVPNRYRHEFREFGDVPDLPWIDRDVILENVGEILHLTDQDSLLSLARNYYAGCMEEAVNEALEECSENDLENRACIYNIGGIAADAFASSGYSQGDYAELLVVISHEWREKVGAPKEYDKANMEAASKLWGHWAWGDVWFFSVEERTTCDCCGEEHVETVDSCGGFYGSFSYDTEKFLNDTGIIEHIDFESIDLIEDEQGKILLDNS